MIEDFRFRYFTSLLEYEENQRLRTTRGSGVSVFAISDFSNFGKAELTALPFATLEANNVNKTLTSFSNRSVYTGNSATKEAFKKEISSSQIVHVATHSEVSEQDPLFSTIYLRNFGESDTLESEQALYAYELFNTPFSSEFIMLNSCSSGSGNYMQGTGIMGISRALRYAGANSLALNLWSVNDKVASEFAASFYKYINAGETKSEAIRRAKLNQIQTANANPHFWGAYMLIGNPTPMAKRPAKPALLFSVMALTILVVGYSSRRKEFSFSGK